MTTDENLNTPTKFRNDLIAAAIARLPRVFRLRGFPEEYFRADARDSYVSDTGGVIIYLHKFFAEGDWRPHSKGTLRDILAELLEISGDLKFRNEEELKKFLATVTK